MINCNSIPLSMQEKEEIFTERFSYGGLASFDPDSVLKISEERYAKMFKFLSNENLLETYDSIVREIRQTYDTEVKRLNIQSSVWGQTNSWIEWDVLKQLYYFLCSEGSRHDKYRIANPLEDKLTRREIVNRDIAWEYWLLKQNEIETAWDKDEKVNEILDNKMYRSSCPYPQINGIQISSWGLEQLGRRIRELG